MCVMISVLSFVVVCCGRLTTLCLISVRKIARALLAVPLISPSGSIVLQLIVSFFLCFVKRNETASICHCSVSRRTNGESKFIVCLRYGSAVWSSVNASIFNFFFLCSVFRFDNCKFLCGSCKVH